MIFTDLPGYGYAKISREISSQWPSFIEPYLKERPCLALCLVLIDVNVPPQESDRQLMEFLSASGRPFADRRHQERQAVGQSVEQLVCEPWRKGCQQAKIVPYSARTGAGHGELWQEIREAVRPDNLSTRAYPL